MSHRDRTSSRRPTDQLVQVRLASIGVSGDLVCVVRVDCQPTDTDTAPNQPPNPAASATTKEQPRTWTSGNYTTQATLVAVDGPNVTLRKADGNQVTIRRDLLSKEDQEYIQNSPLGPRE